MIPLHGPSDALRPTAIALGSFDGLHRGHRRVIAAITDPAATDGCVPADGCVPTDSCVPTVVSFWPHPRELLYGETRLRLDLPEEKLELLEPLGIRQLVLLPFDAALAALQPEEFVARVLAEQLQARRVAVGENFRFGVGRVGGVADLERLGADHGITVTVVPMVGVGPERMSSSRIRAALAAGDLDEAARLLERPYRFCGQVVAGRGLGRTLGWPTANLQVDGRKFLPLEGVYAARAWLVEEPGGGPGEEMADRGAMAAVMNLGPQPTVDPLAPSAVEVHLLDRTIELGGLQLLVEPTRLLRRQQRFDGLEALSAQIAADAEQARQLLAAPAQG
ncbi:MAG: bifunctional riboflavin kinase/FAD synthetase [Cyanobium sp.]